MKHTPGPWNIRKNYDGEIYIQTNSTTGVYSITILCQNEDELMANAHLISAAPDLLEACIGLIGILTPKQYSKQFPNIYRKAKAAIAKAEGGLSYENVV